LKAVEAVVFDLDGTLVRSRHDYREMSRRVEGILRDAGVLDEGLSQPRRIWQIIRRGEEGMNELGITGVDRKRIHERVTEALNTVELLALDTVEPMTGALETLRAIKELGLRIGVATRAGSPYAKRCIETTGLDSYVDALLARDEVEHPKPDPRHLLQVIDALGTSPNKVVYIGDTTTDLTTAIEADIAFIGYAGNEEWANRMREAGCEVFVSDLREIIDIIVG
jgi:phosphoglycolate phosphatase-like HAD superfamily hydrolase